MAQAVRLRPVIAEARIQSQANPFWICGGQGDNGTGFSPCILFLPRPRPHPPLLSFYTHSFFCHRHLLIPAIDSVLKLHINNNVRRY